MQKIVRHFMAPKLGRGIVTARLYNNKSASVELEFDAGRGEMNWVRLDADPGVLSTLKMPDSDILFLAARLAITQIQRRIREKLPADDLLELDALLPLWNGDLTESPYGGATAGCTAQPEARVSKKIRRMARLYLHRIT